MTPHLPIVGIGASAGGVEALEAFFRAVPAENGMAFVVVTHLPPDRDSLLAEILGRATRMPVVNARDDQPVEAQHVYVLPPSAILTIREGRLRLRHTGAAERERAPIDVFFTSLAEDQGEHAIGVVLSGGGSDGTLGLKAIKENGGLTDRPRREPDAAALRRHAFQRGGGGLCRSGAAGRGNPRADHRLCPQLGRFRRGTSG